MNQTPAAVLVLAASVCGYAACVRGPDSFGMTMGLVGVGLGMWGVLELVGPRLREHPAVGRPSHATPSLASGGADNGVGLDHASNGLPPLKPTRHSAGRLPDSQLSPEISAQLSLVAHMQGQDRSQILEDLLRRHLPRYTNHRRR